MTNFNQQLRQSSKGAAIRKAGFLTGIHALPPQIKNRLDELLLHRYSPEKALSILEREYPGTNLPSKSAVYAYKSKYLPNSLTKVGQLSQIAESLDIEKMNTASLFLSHLKRFIAIDLNVLQDRWYKSLEEEQQLSKNQRITNELGKMYIEGIKMGMDMLTKLNVNLDVNLTLVKPEVQAEDTRTDLEKQAEGVLYSKYCYERLQLGGKLDDIDLKLAHIFERRGNIDMVFLKGRQEYEANQKQQLSPDQSIAT